MKAYKNPQKFVWICPICFEEKTSGGQGHINAQATGHVRKEHGIYEFADLYIGIGLSIGKGVREGHISSEQMASLRKTGEETHE